MLACWIACLLACFCAIARVCLFRRDVKRHTAKAVEKKPLHACSLDCLFACLLVCDCLCVSFQKTRAVKAIGRTPLHAGLFAYLLDSLSACMLVCDCLRVSFQKKSEKTGCCCMMILLLVFLGDLAMAE